MELILQQEMESVISEIFARMESAQDRYDYFTSTHEALGVALEEWNELQSAIKANALESVREEAMDLAAVLIRLAWQVRSNESLKLRSVK
jgi:NTP pyrophosphatase (non-canonical NTP hydrolase)